LLLYGPPGCGKSFFAEKFAEQTGFSFILVKSSDLASIYVHGSQEKISKLFKQAEENAPTVLCFDEFDAFVPNRSSQEAAHVSSEVNEFLSQLNNCSQRGIFVVATTNRPDMIDPAVLRTGRLDKHVFVPLPDHDARKEMFALYLKGRPHDEGNVDFDRLSDLTEGYIASDIAFIVNDTAMTAAFTHAKITQALLEQAISNTKPSINRELLGMYDHLREKMDGVERSNSLPRIGFKKQ
jgi:transitional endoplasmic reticulum ATPase